MNGATVRRVALFSLLAVAGASDRGAWGADRALSLEEAIVLAIEKNEGIIIEREALESAKASVRGANGAYDPVLELDAGWRRSREPVNSAFSGAPEGALSPTGKSAEAGLSLRQLLPTGGKISLRANAARETNDGSFALLSPAYDTRLGVELRQPLLRDRSIDEARLSVRVAGAERAAALASLRRTVIETVAAVEEAYWALSAARLEVDVREESVRLAEEQLAETEARIASGSAPRTEIAQPRAELERRRGELLASGEAASRAENALKRLILAADDEALWLDRLAPSEDARTETAPVDVRAAIDTALALRPELEVAAAVVERRRAERAFAANTVRPAVDAVLSYDRFGLAGSRNPAATTPGGDPAEIPDALEGDFGRSLENLGDGDFEDARVALVLGIPLGNRAARAATSAARSGERQAEADLARVRKAVRAEVLDAAAGLEAARQRIEAARAAREAAEIQLAAEREQYAVGLSTNFLVLTRQNDLSRARLEEISARADYRTARAEMARATGSLLAERGIEFEPNVP